MTRAQQVKKPLKKLPKVETSGARYAKRLLRQLNRFRRARKCAVGAAMICLLVGTMPASGQSLNDVYQWSTLGSRKTGQFRPLYTTTIQEGTNLWFTDARVRAALSAVAPLAFNSGSGAFSLQGLSSLGSANQIPGMNAAGSAFEWKTFSGNAQILLSFSPGGIAWSIVPKSIGAAQIDTGGVGSPEILDGSVATVDLAPGANITYSDTADYASATDSSKYATQFDIADVPHGTVDSLIVNVVTLGVDDTVYTANALINSGWEGHGNWFGDMAGIGGISVHCFNGGYAVRSSGVGDAGKRIHVILTKR